MQLTRKLFLLTINLVLLIHSVSIYTVSGATFMDQSKDNTEMTEELPGDDEQVVAYDAVVPSLQIAQSAVLFYLHEVVSEQEPVFHYHRTQETISNRYLDLLFPRIISPNAP